MAGFAPYWSAEAAGVTPSLTGGKTSTEVLNAYVANPTGSADLKSIIQDAADEAENHRPHSRSDDDHSDEERISSRRSDESSDRHSRRRPEDSRSTHKKREKCLPITIFLPTGHYCLNGGLTNNVALNMVATGFQGLPNAVIELGDQVVSHGNKAWEGVIFEAGSYVIDAKEEDEEKFVNCIFRRGARVEVHSGYVRFINCLITDQGPTDSEWLLQQDQSHIEMVQCRFEVNNNGDRRTGSLMRLLGCSNISNTITNCVFIIGVRARAESFSRPFYVIQLASTQLLQFTNNEVSFNSVNNRIFFFGGWERVSGINLSATNNTYVNHTPGSLFVALIGGLWSMDSASNPFGSIYISRSTLRNVRLLSFNDGLCNHDKLCARPDSCDHCNYDFSYWDQTITVTYTDIFLLTPSIQQRSAVVDISGPAGTTWTLNLTNSNITVNNGNIPFAISGVSSTAINLTGTTITSTAASGVPATPYIMTSNMSGQITLITNPATTITGTGLTNPVTSTGIVVVTGRTIST